MESENNNPVGSWVGFCKYKINGNIKKGIINECSENNERQSLISKQNITLRKST